MYIHLSFGLLNIPREAYYESLCGFWENGFATHEYTAVSSFDLLFQPQFAYMACSPTLHKFEFEVKIYFFVKFDTWSNI